jgi:uncharacterized membrane protein YjgN (DUF898 family)
MKNYFKFNLTGKKLLPLWLLFLVFFISPYIALILKMKHIQPGESHQTLMFFPLMILLFVIVFIFSFYIAKLTIENIVYKDKNIVFSGSFWKYFGKVILGLFLSIITFGIYMAWFVRNLHRFIVDNSSYDSQNFKFQGKGGKLFVILLLTIMIPTLILSIFMAIYIIRDPNQVKSSILILQVIMIPIMVPYMYFVYKWMVNINYKDYNISWQTNFWNSVGKIAIEMGLTIITLGIYMPLASVRLYKYFTTRTIAANGESKQRFGYDIDHLNDFLFIWGQMLLTIITIGIYYAWAYSKIGNRILSKTYLEKN